MDFFKVIFDARQVEPFRGVTFQACAVFVGTWPAVPHPTALPGGPGSHTPCHELRGGHTFYYLQLDLPEVLDNRFNQFRYDTNALWANEVTIAHLLVFNLAAKAKRDPELMSSAMDQVTLSKNLLGTHF